MTRRDYTTLKGTQWPIAIGGGAYAKDLLDTDMKINEIPAGAIIDKTDLIITEGFDGTTPTVAVAMQDLDGQNEVVLQAATAATAVDRVTTHNDAVNQVTTPKQIVLKGVAANSTVGHAWAAVHIIVPGRANEVAS